MTTAEPVRVLGLIASPDGEGRTATAVRAVLAGAETAGGRTSVVSLSSVPTEEAVAALTDCDAVVVGTPVYRGTYSALLKGLLEVTQRGRYGEDSAPLAATVAATVVTGATPHHFLATESLRTVLASFFAVQVLSPGLYVDHGGFVDRSELTTGIAAIAATHGAALVDLAAAVRGSAALRAIEPML